MMVLVLGNLYHNGAEAEPQVPCYFIFGDSLVDNGNNNQLSSLARADYLPYGIDFPDGPTGRFCNGKTTVDVIGKAYSSSSSSLSGFVDFRWCFYFLTCNFGIFAAQLLGFDDYIPPYSTARGQDILRGVNFASAAAGIRQETGQQLVSTFNLLNLHKWLTE